MTPDAVLKEKFADFMEHEVGLYFDYYLEAQAAWESCELFAAAIADDMIPGIDSDRELGPRNEDQNKLQLDVARAIGLNVEWADSEPTVSWRVMPPVLD